MSQQYPMTLDHTHHDQNGGTIAITAVIGSRAQQLAFRAWRDSLDAASLRSRIDAGHARTERAMSAAERDRVVQRLADKDHWIDRQHAHLPGRDDGYTWRHHDGSTVATVTSGPEPAVGTVHLLHRTVDEDLVPGVRRTWWAWWVIYSATVEQMTQDVMTADGGDIERTGPAEVVVHRVARLSFPVLPPLSTTQAAELADTTPQRFRALVSDARRRHGVELQIPRRQWPDSRTPLYDRAAVQAYLAGRR